MKLTTSKKGFRYLVAALLLLGATFFSVNRASAQVLDDIQLNASLNLNWKNTADATTILEASIQQLVNSLPLLPPGSQQLTDAQNNLNYYKGILSIINEGETVRVAAINALGLVREEKATFSTGVPRAMLLTLYSNGVNLLTN
jgi:hypothetical protein